MEMFTRSRNETALIANIQKISTHRTRPSKMFMAEPDILRLTIFSQS